MSLTFVSLRGAVRITACIALLAGLLPHAQAFDFDDVAAQAKKLAAAPQVEPKKNLSDKLANLNYDQLRDIRFKPDQALWHDRRLHFEVAFLHQGRSFDTPVKINEIVAAYKVQFKQESVGVVMRPACVSF